MTTTPAPPPIPTIPGIMLPMPGITAVPPPMPAANVIAFDAAMKKVKAKERWSNSVMERGYTMLPTILLWGQAKLGLTADELNVLMQIISHWFYAGNDPHPSKGTIARRMGKHPRTVQTYLTSLEKKGFLKRVERFRATKGQDSNGFDLTGLAQKLETIAPEFKKVSEQNKNRRQRVERPAAG